MAVHFDKEKGETISYETNFCGPWELDCEGIPYIAIYDTAIYETREPLYISFPAPPPGINMSRSAGVGPS
jgi:hypothetical protein